MASDHTGDSLALHSKETDAVFCRYLNILNVPDCGHIFDCVSQGSGRAVGIALIFSDYQCLWWQFVGWMLLGALE